MRELNFDVKTVDGTMDTFVALPDSGGPAPPVILYMDIWGMREQLRDIARSFAARGYACAAPNLYYRKGKVHFDRRHADGRTKSISVLDADDRQAMLDFAAHLTDDFVVADTGALLEALRATDGVKRGPAGSFGYCMGGRHVIKVAAAYPDTMRATASLHGTYLVTDGPDSPHLDAPRIKGEVYCGYGALDPFTPPEVIDAVRAAFAGSEAIYTEAVHADTRHGYAIPDRDVFNADAWAQDEEAILAMFGRML